MAEIIIANLYNGMNLLDDDSALQDGETKESVGVEFGEHGIIKPMREDLLLFNFPEDVVDAHVQFIRSVGYIFASTSAGLYVLPIDSLYAGFGTSLLIDTGITTYFRILIVNDEYAVISTISRARKWMPTWTSTQQWGLNTPPDPTLTAGDYKYKAIDPCDDAGSWGAPTSPPDTGHSDTYDQGGVFDIVEGVGGGGGGG